MKSWMVGSEVSWSRSTMFYEIWRLFFMCTKVYYCILLWSGDDLCLLSKLAFSIVICSRLWNKELIFDLLRGEVVCIMWLVHYVVTYWQSIVLKLALAASRSVCLPAREMTHFHMWHACSLSLQWDCQNSTLSQLPQTQYSCLLRWLAAYLPCLATHLFTWNSPQKVEIILFLLGFDFYVSCDTVLNEALC
jgi:hypothetical protein